MKILKALRNSAKKEDGIMLLAALVLLGLGSIILVPLLSYMNTGLNSVDTYETKLETQYAAEAGVEKALWHIKTSGLHLPDGLPPFEVGGSAQNYVDITLDGSNSINGSTVSARITYIDNEHFRIVSTATNPHTNSTIEVFVAPTYSGTGSTIFDNAITALDGDITVENNVTVTSAPDSDQGNLYANGGIYVNRATNIDIYGSASATGTIMDPRNRIHEQKFPHTAPLDFTPIDTDALKAEAAQGINGTRYSSIPYSSKEATINNDVYYTSSLNISASYELTINGSLYVNGDLDVRSNAVLSVNGTLYVNGDFTVHSNAEFYAGGTIYVDDDIEIESNNDDWTGGFAVVANGSIELNSNTSDYSGYFPLIASEEGEIIVDSNMQISAILYSPNGEVDLSSNTEVNGVIIAEGITMNTNSKIIYPTDIYDNINFGIPGGGSTITGAGILSWSHS